MKILLVTLILILTGCATHGVDRESQNEIIKEL